VYSIFLWNIDWIMISTISQEEYVTQSILMYMNQNNNVIEVSHFTLMTESLRIRHRGEELKFKLV